MARSRLPGGGMNVPKGANRGSFPLGALGSTPPTEQGPLNSNPHGLANSIPRPQEPKPSKRQKKFL